MAKLEEAYQPELITLDGRIIRMPSSLRNEKKLLNPNLVLGKKFLNFKRKNKKAHVVHESSHKLQIDKGYCDPLYQTINEILPNVQSPIIGRTILASKLILDDISANEVALDYGFNEDVFFLSQYAFQGYKSLNLKKREKQPGLLVADAFGLTSMIIPFKHKSQDTYANKMRGLIDEHLKKIKVIDAVALREHFEETLDRIKNPSQVSDIKFVLADFVVNYTKGFLINK